MYCHGVGMFLYDPQLTPIYNEDGTVDESKKVCNFELLFVRTVNGRKEQHKLPCEIWGTAAERVTQDYKAKDRINILDAVPRLHTWGEEDEKRKVVFRINDFSKCQ